MVRCLLLGLALLASAVSAQNEVFRAWSVRLSVQAGIYQDSDNLFGQSKVSRAFIDPPPAPGNPARVRLTFAHGGSVDVRAFSRARTRWEFTVETDVEDADVVLRWENTAKVPRQVNLRLLDTATGRRLWMRTAPSYTFRSGKGVTRRQFVVEMDTDARLPLRISQVKVQQTRGSMIGMQFMLSQPASTQVRVLSASGKIVREIEKAVARSAGVQNVQWDGRDTSGTALPAGAYLLEVIAASDEMEQARAVIPFVLRR
ncbi:MAG: FlgD immunoglobulin-like domain containing protein [Armatimonadota bacterium]